MHDYVCAVVYRANKVASCAKCIVDNDGHTRLMRNRHNLLEIRNVVLWVSDTFELSRNISHALPTKR